MRNWVSRLCVVVSGLALSLGLLALQGCPITTCFVGGTQIATPEGSKAIEKLEVGARVLSYDFAQKKVVTSVVTKLWAYSPRWFRTLHFSDGARLKVTSEHPFYALDRRVFVPARALLPQARILHLRAVSGQRQVEPGRFEQRAGWGVERVYNISVAGTHNYFANGVLVHNKSPGVGRISVDHPSNTVVITNRDIQQSKPAEATLTNSGHVHITISEVKLVDTSGILKHSTPPLPLALGPGESMKLTLRASVEVQQITRATVEIQSPDADNVDANGNYILKVHVVP